MRTLRLPGTTKSWALGGLAGLFHLLSITPGFALGQTRFVEFSPGAGSFALVQDQAAAIYADANDLPGVVRAAHDLQADVARVSGRTPAWAGDEKSLAKNTVIIGSLGRSALIDRLVREGKIEVAAIRGKWESYLIQVVANPLPGVANALVIAGSDKRGAIYGVYDVSEQIGVSPWYYWADVPARHHDAVYVKAGRYLQGPPSVKYRGIFLNDEAPDLSNWIREKYGSAPGHSQAANYGPAFYTNLFEVILRTRGNYLWPAMWNNAFNEDDPQNAKLADDYGIVMGTSHQEPMLRAQKEWDWGAEYGRKYRNWNWSVAAQQPVLEAFWREGVRRNKNFESIFTMGLRAENDSGAPIGKDLTAQIVDVQRKILAEEVNPDLAQMPQLWCLYKEVQDFYNQGLRPPDDVTLLWAEDNWGNVRRLPTAEERKRSGGAGIYYHFDYHGGPRSYQWINTSPLAKIWDQMSLAKQYGADRIWIVNVGHFKGYEIPMEYFLGLGWDAERWNSENIGEYTRQWAEREFGTEYAAEIAGIVAKYTKYNGRRKPELLEATTYSAVNYQEWEKVAADYQAIATQAEMISGKLPAEMRDAFYELVLFPAKAGAQVNALYLAAAQNALYAQQGRASANDKAAQARTLFQADADLMDYFNHTLAGGKWSHFMDQSHIGYTSWQDPPRNNMNAIRLREIEVPAAAAMGVAVEGSETNVVGEGELPAFDVFNQQRHYIEIFNQGKTPFEFTATASEPWIALTETQGTVEKDRRLWVTVDWQKAPPGTTAGAIKLAGAGSQVTVKWTVFKPADLAPASVQGFVEGEGVVSIEPEHYTRKMDAGENRWIRIEDYGHTLSGMRTTQPITAPSATPLKDSPCLEYRMYLVSTGAVTVSLFTSPTLNFMPDRGLSLALSFDDEAPRTVTLVPKGFNAQNGNRDWEETVRDNARYTDTPFSIPQAGYHTLKVWMIDPGVVVQKLVVDCGGMKMSYLGPPESFHRGGAN